MGIHVRVVVLSKRVQWTAYVQIIMSKNRLISSKTPRLHPNYLLLYKFNKHIYTLHTNDIQNVVFFKVKQFKIVTI